MGADGCFPRALQATFNIPGVAEHCCFLKTVDDAITLRSRLVAQFEAASLPNLTDAKREALLTFVVVGGGPTGVEFSGELFDFLRQDVRRSVREPATCRVGCVRVACCVLALPALQAARLLFSGSLQYPLARNEPAQARRLAVTEAWY